MKKYIFMAVAGMLALSSCSNDDNDQTTQNAPRQMTFTAGFGDEAQTRASLYDNMKKVKFDAGDQISILSANNNNVTFTTSAGGASATFTGTATDDSEFYAVYPYTDGLALSGTTISGVTIPYNQSVTATSDCCWDPTAPIAYATNTGTSLQFKNACALLKITNDRGVASRIEVSCHEALAGTFSLNTSSGALSGSEAYPFVRVMNVPANKTIYIAIAPGTKNYFTATWNRGGSYAMKEKASFTFEAGKIYDLGKTNEWEQY